MTVEKLQTLWDDFANKTGYSRLQSYVVMSDNVLQQICSEPSFIAHQQLWLSFGGDSTWEAIFERRGIPKVLIIKTPDVLEFTSNS